MFEIVLKPDNFKKYLDKAEQIIIKDREQFTEIYDCIIEFISLNKELYISDVNLLIGKHKYFENIQIYTVKETLIKDLLNILCDKFGPYFRINGSDYEKSYYIEYVEWRLCTFTKFSVYNNLSVNEFRDPIKYTYKSFTVSLFPPILEIIGLYTQLYCPNLYSEWQEILDQILYLETLVTPFIKSSYENIKQNFQNIKMPINHNIHNTLEEFININKLDNKSLKNKKKYLSGLLLDYLSNNDSDYIILNQIHSQSQKIEHDNLYEVNLDVLSKNEITVDVNLISNFINRYVKYKLVFDEIELNILKDYSTKKYHIYAIINNTKHHILTIYNNLSYELVNYYISVVGENNLKIADPITSIKFIYMDIWDIIVFSKFLKNYDNITKDIILNYMKEKMNELNRLKTHINISEKKENYIGIYINPFTTIKKVRLLYPNLKTAVLYCNDV